MIDLEQSRKHTTQLKETLKKERDEGNKLKGKFEDMHNEVRASKIECQTLQESKMALEVSVEKNERDAHNSLAELQKIQLEYQVLKIENNVLKVSYEALSAEKDQLQSEIVELEAQKVTTEERENQYRVHMAGFEV